MARTKGEVLFHQSDEEASFRIACTRHVCEVNLYSRGVPPLAVLNAIQRDS